MLGTLLLVSSVEVWRRAARSLAFENPKADEGDRKAALEEEGLALSSPFAPGSRGWQDGSIESFLEAMHAWALDSPLLNDEACWKQFAMLLMAGKAYE